MAKIALCIGVFAALALPAIFVNSAIGYVPALFFVVLVALCFAYCRICRRMFTFDELLGAASCVRGGSVDVLLRVRNASPLFVPRVDVDFAVSDLFGNVTGSDHASIAVNPKALQDFSFALDFGHIGEFDVGLEKLVIHDPLGLFKAEVPADTACTVTVTPRLHEVDAIPLSDTAVKQVSEALRPSNLPGSDYCGVRDYAPGDPMKLIHWKLSARGESYYTKLFEEQCEPSLDIYVDLSAPEYDAESLMDLYDAAIETSLSLEAYAHEKGLDTRMVYLDEEGEATQFILTKGSDFRDLMRSMPKISPGSSEAFERMVSSNATALQAADNIAVCSAHCGSSMAQALAQVRATQRNVLMFALMPAEVEEHERRESYSVLHSMQSSGVLGYPVVAGGGRL